MSEEFKEWMEWDFLEPLREMGIMDEIGMVVIAISFVIVIRNWIKDSKKKKQMKAEKALEDAATAEKTEE